MVSLPEMYNNDNKNALGAWYNEGISTSLTHYNREDSSCLEANAKQQHMY